MRPSFSVSPESSYNDVAKVPAHALVRYPGDWSKHLGEGIAAMFPQFANAFPKTVLAIELHWSPTTLHCRAFIPNSNEYICKIFCTQSEKMLVMELEGGKEEFMAGELFDQGREMLPHSWKELHRWFDSFYIVEGREFQRYWINSPFAFATRVNADEYAQKIGADKSTAKTLEKFIGSPKTQIKCWLYTEAGDALFLDEARNDHKVYHVNKGNIKDIAVLPHPGDTLDAYLAHYVSGKAPKDFDFRAS